MDSTITTLAWIGTVTGALASLLSLFMAVRSPEQRKGHIARAVLFAAVAIVAYTSR